jgi:hypothetical protein
MTVDAIRIVTSRGQAERLDLRRMTGVDGAGLGSMQVHHVGG